jgi:pentatricopeptide repeat protein
LWLKAKELLVESGSKWGLKPDTRLFNSIIEEKARKRDESGVVELLNTMKTTFGEDPDLVTYSSVLNMYAELGMVKKMQSLFDSMVEKAASDSSPPPSSPSDSVEASALDSSVGSDSAFSSSTSSSLEPNLVIYSIMIKGYTGVLDSASVLRLLKKMREKNIQPNSVIYGLLVRLFSRLKDEVKAVSTLKQMQDSGMKPDR